MREHTAILAAALPLLLACLLLLPASADEQGGTKSLAQPDYDIYLRKAALLAQVREVVSAHPDTMKYETRHAKDGDYKADVLVVTVEPAGLSPTHKSKARLLLDFGEHGREFITSEVGLKLLTVLGDPQQLSQLVGGGRRAERLQAILQHCVLKVLPMENVAGRDIVEGGNLCERKNGRGVDPNRNWDIDWGVKEKDYDPKEEYPGTAALSEPEVQVLLTLAKELKPHVWLNVHSGMYALFTPYDHKGHVPNTTDARAALRMMKRIQELNCPQCKVGSGGHTVGYLAHGTATDYMFEVLKVPMSFTWEIYGDESASYDDCFRMFNPLGKQHFDEVSTLWVKALLQLVELLPTHPATWPYFKKLGLDRWEAVAPSSSQGNATQAPQDSSAQPAAAATAGTNASETAADVGPAGHPPPPADAAQASQEPEEQQQPQPTDHQQQQGPMRPPLRPPATQQQQQQQQSAPQEQPAPPTESPQQQPAQQEQPVQQEQPAQQQQQEAKASGGPADPAAAAAGDAVKAIEQRQPPAAVTPMDSDSSTEVSLAEHLGDSSSRRGRDQTLVLMNKVLPWALGLGGFAAVLYLVTRDKGQGYDRLPVRQPPPSRR